MQKCVGVCRSVHECVEVYVDMCRSVQNCAEVCRSVQECVRLCIHVC